MKIANIIEHYVLSTLHNFLTLGGSHIAYGVEWGDCNTSLCAFKAASPEASSTLLCLFGIT